MWIPAIPRWMSNRSVATISWLLFMIVFETGILEKNMRREFLTCYCFCFACRDTNNNRKWNRAVRPCVRLMEKAYCTLNCIIGTKTHSSDVVQYCVISTEYSLKADLHMYEKRNATLEIHTNQIILHFGFLVIKGKYLPNKNSLNYFYRVRKE